MYSPTENLLQRMVLQRHIGYLLKVEEPLQSKCHTVTTVVPYFLRSTPTRRAQSIYHAKLDFEEVLFVHNLASICMRDSCNKKILW